jgi:hypothetical protein
MGQKTRFDNVQIPGSLKQIKSTAFRRIAPILATLFPLAVYMAIFYYSMTFTPLRRSPMLQFVGAATSFVIIACTIIFTFCFGFVTGLFEYMQQSFHMLPFTQSQLRVVTGMIFTTAIIIRFFNLMIKTDAYYTSVFIPVVCGLALFFCARWLNNCQDLGLSVSEQIFIAIGYPVFFFFQKGRGFNLKRRTTDNE